MTDRSGNSAAESGAVWSERNLRQMLIAQQEEYSGRGLEHALYAETDTAFYERWMHHRLAVLSAVPEDCRRPGTRVLDVGGGKGRMVTLLSDLGLQCMNIDILFLDADARSVKGEPFVPQLESYHRQKGAQYLGRDVLLDGIPYPDQCFDLAICSEVIEHLPNSPKPMLSEILRTLVKGGWLILTTPNAVSAEKRLSTLLGHATHFDLATFYPMQRGFPGAAYRGHKREYTRAQVEQMLNLEGFVVSTSKTQDFAPPTRFGDLVSRWLHFRTGISVVLKALFPDMGGHILALARRPNGE